MGWRWGARVSLPSLSQCDFLRLPHPSTQTCFLASSPTAPAQAEEPGARHKKTGSFMFSFLFIAVFGKKLLLFVS